MRKSKKMKEAKKEHKKNMKVAEKIFLRNKDTILAENIVLSGFNLISKEYCVYTQKFIAEYFEKTFNAHRNVKRVINEEKCDGLDKIDLKAIFEPVSAYLKGVNKRIGDINDFKEMSSLNNKLSDVFYEVEKEVLKDNNIKFYETIAGYNISSYYVHNLYAIKILDIYIDKCTRFSKKDIRYLKTTLTKFKKVFKNIGEEILKRQDYYLKNFSELPKKLQAGYIIAGNLYILDLKHDSSTIHIWDKYYKELLEYDNERLSIERESTDELLLRAGKTIEMEVIV